MLSTFAAWQLAGDEPAPVPNVMDRLRQQIDDAPLEMRLKEMSASDCRAFQERFRAKLKERLGPFQPPELWKTKMVSSVALDGYRREELVLESEGLPALPMYLLVPDASRNGRRPCVLALHGHGEFGHHAIAGRDDLPGVAKAIAGANYDYGRQLAVRGYMVACPCFTPFGDRLGGREAFKQRDPCDDVFLRMMALGRVLLGENLRDALWALNHLLRQEQADAERVACVGLSLGGRMAMLTTALEPRIRVAVISGALNVMQERLAQPYSCGAQIIPGMLQYGDVPEIGALIAPRFAVWEMGSRDNLVKPKWAEEAIGRMRKAYRALGADDHLVIDRFEGGHQWHGEVGYKVMEQALV
ncbi:MAG TPA: alpha/beta hydrolase family protein [Pirellulaceae bacterium]|jgi:dienelactone hydrolase